MLWEDVLVVRIFLFVAFVRMFCSPFLKLYTVIITTFFLGKNRIIVLGAL